MERITRGKKAELVESARLPFSKKLALTAAANRSENQWVLSETSAEPVLEVIKLFNLAVKEQIFASYALAGGLAVEFYGAPINTVDAHFLVLFPETGNGLLDPSAFFEFFRHHGAIVSGEYLELQGAKFQMLPANRALDMEALKQAVSVCEQGIPFSVVSLEYLIALKLNAWRYKDRLHISHLLDSGVNVDKTRLGEILRRYQLDQRWQQLVAERSQNG